MFLGEIAFGALSERLGDVGIKTWIAKPQEQTANQVSYTRAHHAIALNCKKQKIDFCLFVFVSLYLFAFLSFCLLLNLINSLKGKMYPKVIHFKANFVILDFNFEDQSLKDFRFQRFPLRCQRVQIVHQRVQRVYRVLIKRVLYPIL